jgi:hypothetical protein
LAYLERIYVKYIASLFLIVFPYILLASETSPYVGEELRPIKSLSESEIQSLRNGDGMGFAKVAELNHFPGPKHVLEISEELRLSSSQRAATEILFEEMRRNAVALGEQLVLAESRLDREFENGTINTEALKMALLEIGKLQAQLRFVHLEAHLRQNRLLSPDQVLMYDTVRGYTGALHNHQEHSKLDQR